MIVTIAVAFSPAVIAEPSKDDTDKFILNVSSPSKVLSSITEIFTTLLLIPASIVIFCIAELKSFSEICNQLLHLLLYYVANLMHSL